MKLEGLTAKESKENFGGDGNVFYLNYTGGYMSIYIHLSKVVETVHLK